MMSAASRQPPPKLPCGSDHTENTIHSFREATDRSPTAAWSPTIEGSQVHPFSSAGLALRFAAGNPSTAVTPELASPTVVTTELNTYAVRPDLDSIVPRHRHDISNPVYVKNTFLEADGASSLTSDADAVYRSRTESCDAVLEGCRRHHLSLVPPETVHEVYDDYDESQGTPECDEDTLDRGSLDADVLYTLLDHHEGRLTLGNNHSVVASRQVEVASDYHHGQLLQVNDQHYQSSASNFQAESPGSLYDYATICSSHQNSNHHRASTAHSTASPDISGIDIKLPNLAANLVEPAAASTSSDESPGKPVDVPGRLSFASPYIPSSFRSHSDSASCSSDVTKTTLSPTTSLAVAIAGLPAKAKLVNGYLPFPDLPHSELSQLSTSSMCSYTRYKNNDSTDKKPRRRKMSYPHAMSHLHANGGTSPDGTLLPQRLPPSNYYMPPPSSNYYEPDQACFHMQQQRGDLQSPVYVGSSRVYHLTPRMHRVCHNSNSSSYNSSTPSPVHHQDSREKASDYSDNNSHMSGDLIDHQKGDSYQQYPSHSNSSGSMSGSLLPSDRPIVFPKDLPEDTGMTTIMLRNIPNKYTQKMLLEVINQNFSGLYDFFYLPIDFRNKCNVGYAFINFIHSHYSVMFKEQFDGLKLGAFKSNKVCEVSWGRVQGLQANIEHYRNSAVMSIPIPQYRPMLFLNGILVPFPCADGPLPSVKLRPQKF